MNTNHKPRLNTQKILGPTGLYELHCPAVHMETSNVQPKCQGPLQLLSPPFLVTSTTKQMRPNGRGAQIQVKKATMELYNSNICTNAHIKQILLGANPY